MDSWGYPLSLLRASICTALIWLLVGHTSLASDVQPIQSNTDDEESVDNILTDVDYINSLLFKREFPVIGGRWGWEMFVDAPLNSEPEGAEITLRRAKLKYVRSFGNDWRLKLTGDYSRGGNLELSDNYFSYSGWNRAMLALGIRDPAFSLESVSQSSALTFMERALPVAALSERKSGGVSFLRRSPHNILNASLILFNVSQDNLREDGQGIVLHYVYSPVEYGNDDSIHLGGSFSYRINASEDSTQFRSRPEVATVNDYFVDTGLVAGSSEVGRLSIELSQVRGRFSWQTELLTTRVHRDASPAVDFWGTYFFVSWFLTEDKRNYQFGSGDYEQVSVGAPFLKGGKGAFELAFRGSYVDLTDQSVIGGREKNLSLGLNWYLNQKIRLMANVVKVLDVDRPGHEYDGMDPLIFSLRAQWVLN
ncbi:OprO/OprP family phosphate-selective porin [Pseudomonadota bacterium]